MYYTENMSVGRWRESVTITVKKKKKETVLSEHFYQLLNNQLNSEMNGAHLH